MKRYPKARAVKRKDVESALPPRGEEEAAVADTVAEPNAAYQARPGRGDHQTDDERLILAKRRQRAWHLHIVRKMTIPEIAQVLGVATITVSRDLAVVRKRSRDLLRRSQKAETGVLDEGTQAIEETAAIIRQAWADCMKAPEGSTTRSRFLNVALKALTERVKILQSLGLAEKVPEKMQVDGFNFDALGRVNEAEKLAFARKMLDQARQEIAAEEATPKAEA